MEKNTGAGALVKKKKQKEGGKKGEKEKEDIHAPGVFPPGSREGPKESHVISKDGYSTRRGKSYRRGLQKKNHGRGK